MPAPFQTQLVHSWPRWDLLNRSALHVWVCHIHFILQTTKSITAKVLHQGKDFNHRFSVYVWLMLTVLQSIFVPIKTNSADALRDVSEHMTFANWWAVTQGLVHVLLLTFLLLLKPRSITMSLSHRIRPLILRCPRKDKILPVRCFRPLLHIQKCPGRTKTWVDKLSHVCHSCRRSKETHTQFLKCTKTLDPESRSAFQF